MVKIVSWNIAHRPEPWQSLLAMEDVDVALVQEASPPPMTLPDHVEIDPSPWRTAGGFRPWKAAVVKLSERVRVEWIEARSIADASYDYSDVAGYEHFAVSHAGTLAVARVTPLDCEREPFIVASMYGAWENRRDGSWIVADGTVHRIISDLSWFVGTQNGHRIIAAGDLNIYHGYGDNASRYWKARYDSVFDRMSAIGLPFVGPQHPGGQQAVPWPDWLPSGSRNVPTYYHSSSPETATDQLDFVFASASIQDTIRVRALNLPEEWGPSDHCRVEIIVA